MKAVTFIAALGALVVGATSCQKVVEIKPNAFTQKYIIEGEVTDAPGPYFVTLSRTRSVSDDNTFEGVGGAEVIISDLTAGLTDTLQYGSAGRYQTTRIAGAAGHEYRLSVRIGDETFTANSTIPTVAIGIDSLYAEKSQFADDYFIIPVFTDPVGRGNYYRLQQWVNNRLVKGYWLRNDNARDGQTYTSALRFDTEEGSGNAPLQDGDTVRVELQSIGRDSYEYYRTLEDVTGYSFTTPANPLSNISGGALGVFTTGLSRTRGIRVRF